MAVAATCFVNSLRTLGGAELWTVDAALGLRERGHPVSVVAQPDSALLSRARDAGLPTDAVAIRFDGAPWTLARLCGVLRRRRARAIVCNLTKDLKAAGVAARLCGLPVILASRESDFPLKDKAYYRWYFTRVATGLLVNSQATRATVLGSAPWLDPGRVHLLYKGVDPQRFRPAASAPEEPVAGFAGQLIERKGVRDLMAAWARIETGAWSVAPRLRIAGEGPLAADLRRWRERLRAPDRVELLGFVERIEEFYGGLSLLVLPSREEGFGLVAAEAAACGLPVVATAASSLPELVADGETGLLVPPRDPLRLAAAITRLFTHQALAARLGARGRARVLERFTRTRMLDRLEALLEAAGVDVDAPRRPA